jgi:hypothetical protein
VWAQPHSTNTNTSPQLWISVQGGPPRQLTHLTWSSADPGLTSGYWLGTPAISPDGAHVAFGMGYGQGDVYQTSCAIYVADTASGAIVPVPTSGGLVNNRLYAWLDNNTLIAKTHSDAIEKYDVATQNMGVLASIPAVNGFGQLDDLEVRGTTLWFDITQDSNGVGQTTLYAYDLATSQILRHVSLGYTVDSLPGMPAETHWQGWDVSPDGQHLVWQQTTVASGQYDHRINSSAIWYASVDLSNPSRILRYLSTNSVVHLAISPDGNWVAVTDAAPTPNVVSGSVHSAGAQGDPTFHSYTPDAVDQPAWESDSASFYATSSAGIMKFSLNSTPNAQGRIPGMLVTNDARVPATSAS